MKKIHTYLLLFLSTLSFTACSDWLDIEPEGEATNDKLTATGDGYRTMLSGIYKAMTAGELYGIDLQFGLVDCLSQQYTWRWNTGTTATSTAYTKAAELKYYDVDVRKKIDDLWAKGYNVIANTNNLIQNLQNEQNANKFSEGQMEMNMILGEAYACRALMHFDLCRLFAPAPIENDNAAYLPYVDSYPNIQPEAIPTQEFLEKVVADFKKAQELTIQFDTTALGMSANSSSNSRFYRSFDYAMEGAANNGANLDDFFLGRGYRLNYYAITALLARVYQYIGDEESAFKCAQEVMNFKAVGLDGMTTYSMFTSDDWGQISSEPDLEKQKDLKCVSNLIFALYNEDAYVDYQLSSYFQKSVNQNEEASAKWFVVDVTGQDIFKIAGRENGDETSNEATTDYRYLNLLFQPTDAFQSAYEYDYKVSAKGYCSNDIATLTRNTQTLPIIRGTEMRYIMAEYYARQNNFQEAYNILEEIRRARGLNTPLEVKSTWNEFQNDLVRDAQREWIGEGQLFYLYKRLGAPVKIYGSSNGSGNAVKRKFNKSEYMLPIPDNQNM